MTQVLDRSDFYSHKRYILIRDLAGFKHGTPVTLSLFADSVLITATERNKETGDVSSVTHIPQNVWEDLKNLLVEEIEPVEVKDYEN